MKALVLFSGGLDSMLAIRLLKEQGIEVTAVHIDIGFGAGEGKFDVLEKRAAMAGAKLKIVDIRSEYLQNVLFNPKFGYGKHFNPCIDCHAYMFKTALSMLEDEGASFIATGEVLGQRPMSQKRDAMVHVKTLARDEDDLILRPMSALLMKPTKPERDGWVDREHLLGLSGRDRKPQIKLAKEFGFSDFESPAGGCLLTVEGFANKIKDFLKFDKDMSLKDMQLLRIGRHLRLKNGSKMVIGRDESDNEKLLALQNPKFAQIEFDDSVVGAVSFINLNADEEDLKFAVRLALAYTRADKEREYSAKIGEKTIIAKPFEDKSPAQEWFIT
ncbi:argininosuccinate synthase domain-containing protein [Campylobacter sp. RM16192]|uniref:argininosuccinate synthase domain-containing protein n=1 Tax=Campylobacter sp. RM16192 TaxID=1660080 RepID=UPI001451FD27|nr:argininosuccinate synthase domain-containing protein [Campylobacter sp. RM16192]QCD53435.1 putative tRNA(5-methylaminomethyl-2-thiouridylate) methyltransferase [Campylobacter sp. RM16192]